jgi:hypothetical protein
MRHALRTLATLAVALLTAATLTGATRVDQVTTAWLPCPVTAGTDKVVRVTFQLYQQAKSSPLAQPIRVEWKPAGRDIASGEIIAVRLLYVALWGDTLGDHYRIVAYPLPRGFVWFPQGTYRTAPLTHDPTAYVELYATNGTVNCRAHTFRP